MRDTAPTPQSRPGRQRMDPIMTDEYPEFRTVLRGYDPAQVEEILDEVFAALEEAVKGGDQAKADVVRLTAEHERTRTALQGDLEQAQARATQLEQVAREAPATFENLGSRIGSMLSVADEEASEIRRNAREEAEALRNEAQAAAMSTRMETDHYVERLRAAAEEDAATITEQAQQAAAALRAEAERDAAGIRERTAALYGEAQTSTEARRAELDRSTAERRQQADAQHAALLAEHEEQLRAARARVVAVETTARERLMHHVEHREQVRAKVREVRTQLTALIGPAAGDDRDETDMAEEAEEAGQAVPVVAARPAPPEPPAQPADAPEPADATEPAAAAEPTPEAPVVETPAAEAPDAETFDVTGDDRSEPATHEHEPVAQSESGVVPQSARRRHPVETPDGDDESFEGEPWAREGEEPPRRRWSLSSRR